MTPNMPKAVFGRTNVEKLLSVNIQRVQIGPRINSFSLTLLTLGMMLIGTNGVLLTAAEFKIRLSMM